MMETGDIPACGDVRGVAKVKGIPSYEAYRKTLSKGAKAGF